MAGFDTTLWAHWLDITDTLLPRLFVTIIAALVLIRLKWFRLSIREAESAWLPRFILIIVFGSFALIGTHWAIPIDLDKDDSTMGEIIPHTLNHSQALIGFRDTWTLVAGLAGGFWVGLGTGLLVGIERYTLSGVTALSSGYATFILGLFAGAVRHFRPEWIRSTWLVLAVALAGTLLQRMVLLLMVQPMNNAITLAIKIGIPVGIVNISGCVLFFWIMRDLDREHLENEASAARLQVLQAQLEQDRLGQLAQQAELRALRAQVAPHFLNNTLNDINALIRIDPAKARRYVVELADFFNGTREFSGRTTITLKEEMAQLQRYLDLQHLRLNDKLQECFEIPTHLLTLEVLPGSLLTLVENAFKHGFKQKLPPYQLTIRAVELDTDLVLSLRDNGVGITSERLSTLAKAPVSSVNKGGGVALYQLAQCLTLEFGETARITLDSKAGDGTQVSLIHPKRNNQ